jgi:hypothetical protein
MASIANEQTFYKMRDDEKRGFRGENEPLEEKGHKVKLNVQEKWVARVKI